MDSLSVDIDAMFVGLVLGTGVDQAVGNGRMTGSLGLGLGGGGWRVAPHFLQLRTLPLLFNLFPLLPFPFLLCLVLGRCWLQDRTLFFLPRPVAVTDKVSIMHSF